MRKSLCFFPEFELKPPPEEPDEFPDLLPELESEPPPDWFLAAAAAARLAKALWRSHIVSYTFGNKSENHWSRSGTYILALGDAGCCLRVHLIGAHD